jgi:hypothetical protein
MSKNMPFLICTANELTISNSSRIISRFFCSYNHQKPYLLKMQVLIHLNTPLVRRERLSSPLAAERIKIIAGLKQDITLTGKKCSIITLLCRYY